VNPVASDDEQLEEGFTLLEVLVALAILSVAFTVLLGIFSQSLTQVRALREREAARALAQSLLAEQGTDTSIIPGTTGGWTGAFSWQIDTSPYGGTDSAAPRLAAITVRVRWHDGDRTMTLTSLRLMPEARSK